MQIITLSIIYRELCVYTVLYRASNTEGGGSEWDSLSSGDVSRNNMIRWKEK